jgi:hypothetical protein
MLAYIYNGSISNYYRSEYVYTECIWRIFFYFIYRQLRTLRHKQPQMSLLWTASVSLFVGRSINNWKRFWSRLFSIDWKVKCSTLFVSLREICSTSFWICMVSAFGNGTLKFVNHATSLSKLLSERNISFRVSLLLLINRWLRQIQYVKI